jgi:hypothetical protein
MRGRILAAATAVTALAAAGWATTQPAAAPLLAGATDAAAPTVATQSILFEDATSEADDALLARAEEELTRRCMRDLGLPYYPGRSEPPYTRQPTASGGYGLARDFRAWPHGLVRQQVDFLQGLVGAEGQAYSDALNGTARAYTSLTLPTGLVVGFSRSGCVAEARRTVYGDVEAHAGFSGWRNILRGEAALGANAQPALVEALDRWRECMRSMGEPTETHPEDISSRLRGQFAEKGPTPALAAEEVRLAALDMTCRTQSNFDAAQIAAREVSLQVVKSKRAAVLNEFLEWRSASLERAANLIQGTDSS